MNIEGLDEFIRLLDNSEEQFREEAKRTVNNIGNKVLRKVKLKTPVAADNGGTLRRSWHTKKGEDDFTRIIYNNLHYAPHVEYGHRTRQGMGNSNPPDYKYKPKPGGITFVPGVYMLKKSIDEVESSVDQDLETLIENLWRE